MLDYARAGDTVVVTAIDRLEAGLSPKSPGPLLILFDRRIVLRALT